MKSLLRALSERGDSISLEDDGDISVKLSILPSSGKVVPESWLADNSRALKQQLRQIKQNGIVSPEDVKIFFASGGRFVQEQTPEQWLNDYSKQNIF